MKEENQKIFRLNTIIDGRIISGYVTFSPAPQPGVLTELARFEAQRVLTYTVREAIAQGRI